MTASEFPERSPGPPAHVAPRDRLPSEFDAVTKLSLPKERISILLLEGISEKAVASFGRRDYTNVVRLPKAISEAELLERIADVHMIGIRSRTRLPERVIEAARKLFCVGCFCIGTDQVDLQAARRRGIPVFNAPYSNTRSVAELVLGEIIMLFRGVHQKSLAVHRGQWPKSAENSYEVRGKVLGIVGYGHIGSQLSVLAESVGMRVRFYDIEKKLAIGNAEPCDSLDALLADSDVVSLHVPDTPETREMIGARELKTMKPGAHLVNASRGKVVVIPALVDALQSGHLMGAAVDVFPVEPASNQDALESPLRGLDSVILTPHVGGSTQEAQQNIGTEVAEKLIAYSDSGTTVGAVNFPEVSLPVKDKEHVTRFLHIHENRPGILRTINDLLAERTLNVRGQYLQTDAEIGYVVVDVEGPVDETELLETLRGIGGTVRARFLY